MNPNISIVIATHNEEKNIARCLESVEGLAGEIIIVDGESTDNTVAIAKKFKSRIISTTNKPNFHINKQMGIDEAKGDWILQLDADEFLSPKLKVEISKVVKSDEYNGYWMPRLNYFLGRYLKKGGQYPDYTMRLYKRDKGKLPALNVHEQAVVEGPVGYLTADLMHHGTPDFENYLVRNNKYTSLMASELEEKKVALNALGLLNYLFIKPSVEFFLIYFRHLGFRDGFPGFVFALFSGLRFGIAYIKYWQKVKFS